MDTAMLLLCGTLFIVLAVWALGVWIGDRIALRLVRPNLGNDPILGPRDRIAIHDTRGPFIPMPQNLRTQDEMVAWMTRDLPRLLGEDQRPRAR
jgi:hypothetical protein